MDNLWIICGEVSMEHIYLVNYSNLSRWDDGWMVFPWGEGVPSSKQNQGKG